MNEHIEHLARQNNFHALSPAEQEIVLAEMPRDEFDALREILLRAPGLDTGMAPSPQMKARLLSHLTASPLPAPFWQKRVPLWQAAAVFATVLMAVWFLKKETTQMVRVPFVQLKTDTIYREQLVWRDRIVWKAKVIYREKPAAEQVEATPKSADNQFVARPWIKETTTGDPSQAPVGTSLADEPELLDFFVEIK